MASGWEHEPARDDRTMVTRTPFDAMVHPPTDNAWLQTEPVRAARARSIFWPVYLGVLLALITFAFLLVLVVSWLAGHQTEELRLTYRLDVPPCASSLPLL